MERIGPIVTLRSSTFDFSHTVSYAFIPIPNDYNFFSKQYKTINEISTYQVRSSYQIEKIWALYEWRIESSEASKSMIGLSRLWWVANCFLLKLQLKIDFEEWINIGVVVYTFVLHNLVKRLKKKRILSSITGQINNLWWKIKFHHHRIKFCSKFSQKSGLTSRIISTIR